MSTQTKLGAKAANSLAKRRGGRDQNDTSCDSSNAANNSTEIVLETEDALEVSMTDGGNTANRSNVYSFFDPADIRKPPTSPNSNNNNMKMRVQPYDEGNIDIDDAASRGSHGSAATERIGNHRPSQAGGAMVGARPPSMIIEEEREVKYEEGATDLFMLVEDTKWEDVCDR